MTEFDYVIAGAGTAGCVLATRLSEDPGTRVLLLEAGGAERTRAMTMPDAWPDLLGSAADWADVTSAQADAGPVPYPRGRALGGSGAINAMAHIRGHRAVYDGWAAGGAPGWRFADLLPYFRRSESADSRDPALRGTCGPVRVAAVPGPDRHPVAVAFAWALLQLGCPASDDLSGSRQDGVAWPGPTWPLAAFSRGRDPQRRSDPRVCAAQRLIVERYRSRQVWCKDDTPRVKGVVSRC